MLVFWTPTKKEILSMIGRKKATIESTQTRIVETDAQSTAQADRRVAAQDALQALDEAWAAACLSHDVDGAQNDEAIAEIEAQQAEQKREIARAENAIKELAERREGLQHTLERLEYQRDKKRLDKLAATANDAVAAYRAAAIAHVDAAANIRAVMLK